MRFKKFVSMNIAIVGSGTAVETYAAYYALAGHQVFLAGTESGKQAGNRKLSAFEGVTVCGIEDAAGIADIIVIATPGGKVREMAYWLGDVRGKVIIDASANIPTFRDEVVNTTGAIRAITGSANIVKVFSTLGYEHLLQPLFKHEKPQFVLAGDSIKAKEVFKIIAVDLGIKIFYDFGGADALPLFDEMTRCWRNMAQRFIPGNPQTNVISH